MSTTTTPAAAAGAAQQSIQQVADSISTLAPLQFATLTSVRQARVNLFQRQAAAMTTVPGTTASDTVPGQVSIAFQQLSAAKFSAVNEQATTPAPTLPANGWVLHGRVRDAKLQPVAKLTVTLTDQEKAWQKQYGYAFTDATGYFSLTYAPPAPPAASSSPSTTGATTTGAVVTGAATPGTPAATPAAMGPAATTPTTAQTDLHLQLLNEAGQPVYFDSQSFALTPGVALYREITNVSTQPLGSPPVGADEAPGAKG